MGVCCGRGGEDKKVEACKSIDELILLMNTRIENIPLEKKEINEHLKDQTKQITLINTEGVPDEILAKRPEHLDNLLEKYVNKGIDKKSVKPKLEKLANTGIIEFFENGKKIRKVNTRQIKQLLGGQRNDRCNSSSN